MVIFMDTETTGLTSVEAAGLEHQPYIVEITCIKTNYELEIVSLFSTIVRPPIQIPEEVLKVHGITDDIAKSYKPFAGYYRQLAGYFVGTTHLIGHNLQFDKRVLETELKRLDKVTNFPWPPINVCTVEEIQKIKGHRMSLGDLHAELFGFRFEEAHRAEPDTRALIKVYKEMINRRMTELRI